MKPAQINLRYQEVRLKLRILMLKTCLSMMALKLKACRAQTHPPLRNKSYCYICGKPQTKFTRHLITHEKTHAEVACVLILPKRSKERIERLTKLRNGGNYIHNKEV
jgi:hypothetical protein